MVKKLAIVILLVTCHLSLVSGQTAARYEISGVGAPTGTCTVTGSGYSATYVNRSNGDHYNCQGTAGTTTGTWVLNGNHSAGTGTVTSVSVVSANGQSGTVATATTTPAITLNNPTALVATTSVITPQLTLGTVSSVTGGLRLANSASAFLTTIQAGNAAAARTYTWPTNFGAAGTVLTDAAGNGTLSWAAVSGGITCAGCTNNTLIKFNGTNGADSQIFESGPNVNIAGLLSNAGVNIGGNSTTGTLSIGGATGSGLNIGTTGSTSILGDINANGNGTTLTVDDAANTATFIGNSLISLGLIQTQNGLVPTSPAGADVGSAAIPFSSIFVGNAANHSIQVSCSTCTANRTPDFPDASGTVQLVGAANTGAILGIPINNTVLATATGTVYSSPGNDGTALSIATEGNVSFPVTRAGTIRNLFVRTGGTAKTNTPTTVITIRKNGVDTTVTLTMTQTINTTTSDTAHSFTVVAGDLITVSFTTTGAAGISTSIAGVSFEID